MSTCLPPELFYRRPPATLTAACQTALGWAVVLSVRTDARGCAFASAREATPSSYARRREKKAANKPESQRQTTNDAPTENTESNNAFCQAMGKKSENLGSTLRQEAFFKFFTPNAGFGRCRRRGSRPMPWRRRPHRWPGRLAASRSFPWRRRPGKRLATIRQGQL